ncbi:MAG TPA: cytochrome c biogenesis protein CcdA, partial [Candidatus Acidoferrales bacterium]|nr:cytochrome c biogenesis protein CcdA [Candidatus Acidoferrales bacterium]
GAAAAAAGPASDTAAVAPGDTAASAAAPGSGSHGDGFMTAPPAGGSASNEATRKLEQRFARGWIVWLIGLFVGGLGLNLTPCVFPMLGITVSIFGARRREPMPRVAANATAYVLGIVVMYTALGVVAALTGRLFGAALQSPYVSVGLGALMLLLALSMFGVYDLQAPGWLLDRAGGANTSSLAGLFSSGLAVGVVAAPCVGPFLLGVLAVIGQRGSVGFGVQTMLTLSLGLGAPYLVLATSSGLLSALPRAGEWMEWAKKVFGVLMVAIGLNYVMVGLAARQSAWVLPAALVLGGLYLGFMEKSANAMARFRRFKRLAGTAAVLGGVALVLQMTSAQAHTLAFRPYDEAAVRASLAAGRPVLVDFSADWCVPCHELELQVFPQRDVLAAARAFDAYEADLTHGDTPASRRFDVHGVPTIVLLGSNGSERRDLRIEGKISAAEFTRRLQAASAGPVGR